MSVANLIASERIPTRPGWIFNLVGRAVLPVVLAVGGTGSTLAAESEWSVMLEPMFMEAHGHDPHVLTIHEFNLGTTPAADTKTPVTLETDSGLAFRSELQYAREDWALGLDFFWFGTSQGRPSRTAAANGPAGPVDQVDFEVADRTYSSASPGEVLLFSILEDTDVNAWTVDLYAIKTLVETPESGLQLQFGLRNADFDNDFHSVTALQDVAGSLIDASSNYPRMIGPLIGLSGDVHFGRNSIRAYIGQSVIFGTAELRHTTRDFTGPVSDTPTIVAVETFGKDQDVAIPITEFRLNWLYPIGQHVSLGVSANTSVWWDVPVPPGVIPISEGDEIFQENTIVFFGLAVAVKLRL